MKGESDWQRRLDAAAPGLVDRCTLIGTRPRSVILRGRSPAFGDVCIKCDPGPRGLARLSAEYHALAAYHRAEDGPFGVPRPWALVPDPQGGAALVTAWIGCPRADERLARSLPFDGVRGGVLRRAAAWLARFHALGPSDDRPLASVLDLAALRSDLAAALGPAGERGAADGIGGRGAEVPVRVVTLHADFLPQNLFLCPGRTIGIDFTLEVTGPALRDVGSFLANMVWRGYSTVDPRAPARFARDADAFLHAYYEASPGKAAAPERQVAPLFVLAELAQKSRALSAKIAGRRFAASDRLHRGMIVGAIRQLLRRARPV